MSLEIPIARDVVAFNIAAASENKIHDDAIANRLGYRGALVPGVAVYAYMAHMPVARWGRTWLEAGVAECRFRKPVYDGATVHISAKQDAEGLVIAVESDGIPCASGRASIPSDRPPVPDVAAMADQLPPAERPPASENTLAVGSSFGIAPVTFDRAALSAYLDAVGETDPLYRDQGLLHPGQILQLANRALLENVVLGPWIHLGSTIRHYAAARLDDQLSLRANVTANAMVKGHATVEFDAVVIANNNKVVAAIEQAAIWQPRQLGETKATQ